MRSRAEALNRSSSGQAIRDDSTGGLWDDTLSCHPSVLLARISVFLLKEQERDPVQEHYEMTDPSRRSLS